MPNATRFAVTVLAAKPDGESYFFDHDMPASVQAFAPPAAPFAVSDAETADRYVMIELPVGWGGTEPHPTPHRHMLFCLAGEMRVTASSGESRLVRAGDALRLEDTFGAGHRTEVTSPAPVRAVMIRLP